MPPRGTRITTYTNPIRTLRVFPSVTGILLLIVHPVRRVLPRGPCRGSTRVSYDRVVSLLATYRLSVPRRGEPSGPDDDTRPTQVSCHATRGPGRSVTFDGGSQVCLITSTIDTSGRHSEGPRPFYSPSPGV